MSSHLPTADMRIPVLTPDDEHAFFASTEEAHALIRERKAVGLGNKRAFYALRLSAKSADLTFQDRVLRSFQSSELRGVPVISRRKDPGLNELLAPSPRTHFSFKASVSAARDYSPQRLRAAERRVAKDRYTAAMNGERDWKNAAQVRRAQEKASREQAKAASESQGTSSNVVRCG